MGRVEACAKLVDRESAFRMDPGGSDLLKRQQHEGTFVQPRMGEPDRSCFNATAIVKQVEVKRACFPASPAPPSKFILNLVQHSEQLGWLQTGGNRDHRVYKPRLLRGRHRCAAVPTRLLQRLHTVLRQRLYRRAQSLLRWPEPLRR